MSAVIAFFLAGLLFLVGFHFIRKQERTRSNMVRRMEYFSGKEGMHTPEISRDQKLKNSAMDQVRKIALLWRKLYRNEALDFKMQQADWPLLGSEFQVILLAISLAGGLFLLLLTFRPSMFIIGAGGAFLLGMLYLKLHISRRQQAFLNQLGDTLIMVSNALRAGFSFMQAMELISKEMEPPIGAEFQKVINEVNLGATLETAMENMGRRMQSSDFDLVVTAVLIQRQVGGNLSQVLDSISNTINERIRMRREISALTSQGKLSGLIVGAIPIFIVWFVWSSNPNYFDPMLESPIGKGALVAAALLELLAIFIIRKIIDIDV